MSALGIERVWFIECWRCANNEAVDVTPETEAQDYFKAQGWDRTEDGYQLCPQCWASSRPAG